MRKGGDGVELKPGRHLATLASTLRQSVVLCEPQERNTSNRIFGGMFILLKVFFPFELWDMLCGRILQVHQPLGRAVAGAGSSFMLASTPAFSFRQ
jgi:hypothetical protein